MMNSRFFVYFPFCLSISLSVCAWGLPADDPAEAPQASHTIHIVPQSHIDVVWLWRYDPETIHRCCKMTFTRALDNMDRFPEYTFCQSQVPLYEPLEKIYPDIYRRIQEYVRQGRWEIVGGMYVEPEGGEPCGESWVRQCVMGKRWFRQAFSVDVTTGWQPDAWGHPSQLPQIMAKSGIHSYLWRRGDVGGPRNNVTEKMFWWQAPDGSKVLAFRFPETDDLPYANWEKNARLSEDRYKIHDSLLVIGWGDHGGGPSADEIGATLEFARNLPPGYTAKFDTFGRSIDKVMKQNPQLPTISGELGWELHGDLTNVGEIKKSNRECENLLMTAEKWASIAAMGFSYEYPKEELEEAWKKLLFNQFHDILGGSLIPEAYGDAMQYYQCVRDSGEYTIRAALSAIAESISTEGEGQPVIVFNPLSWKRTDAVECVLEFAQPPKNLCLKDAQGNIIPLQIVERSAINGKTRLHCVFVAEGIPSLGYKTFYAVESKDAHELSSSFSAQENRLENEFFLIEIDENTGSLKRLYDKRHQREMLPESGGGNRLIAIEDEGDSEGRFVLRSDTIGKPPGAEGNIDSVAAIRLLENGPERAIVRIEKSYQNSRFTQDVILHRGVDRVDFNIMMDWHDIHRMIKVAFPLALNRPEVAYDAPYDAVVRPADGVEYPAQKWVDLYADGYGVSLINNSRYAHDAQGNTIRLSLLRSPTQPAYNTDEGKHSVVYSLYPHRERWNQAAVVQRGYEFNVPLKAVIAKSHPGALPSVKSFLSVQPENLVLEVVKKAYDSNRIVLRLCDKNGQGGKASVAFPSPIASAHETDLLENDLGKLDFSENIVEFSMNPHEIKTIKVSMRY